MTNLLVLLALLVGVCSVSATKDEYFLVRPDNRDCAFPKCGGFFLKPVNSDKIDCPRGEVSRKSECYVVEITGIDVTPALSMVRGRFVTYSTDLNSFEALDGFEGKINPHPTKNTDKFFSVNNVGIVCVAAPCNIYRGTLLNEKSFSRDLLLFADVDLSRFDTAADVQQQMRKNEVIVSASSYSISGPAGHSLGLTVSNYFTKLAEPPKSCTKKTDCSKSEFCSRDSCDATSGVCIIRPSSCTKNLDPVCSCDGQRQFDNDCIRQLFGVVAASPGTCTPAQ